MYQEILDIVRRDLTGYDHAITSQPIDLATTEIYSTTQYEISVNGNDWHILADDRITWIELYSRDTNLFTNIICNAFILLHV